MFYVPRNLLPAGMIVACGLGGGPAFCQTPASTATPAAEAQEQPSAPEGSPRCPVPSEVVQKETLKMVQAIYGDEIKAARTRPQKQALAEKFLQKSRQMDRDVEGRFALLGLSQDLATQAGDVDTALQAAEQIARLYEVDRVKLKTKMLAQLFRAADDTPKRKLVIEQARRFMEEAAAAERYEVAQQVGAEMLVAAHKLNDRELMKAISNRMKSLKKEAAALADFQEGRATLAKDPADSEANSTVGRYLCLVRNDWEHGLPNLAKGADGNLKTLAQRELTSPPADLAGQMSLADAWWDLAQMLEGRQRKSLELHAGAWYRRLQGKLPYSLLKAKVEKRLAELDAESAARPPEAAGKEAAVPPVKKPATPRTETPVKVVEGVGWGDFQVGATRDELIQRFGPPDPPTNAKSQWVSWMSRYHVDCILDEAVGARNVRFHKDFKLPLASGIRIGSSENDVVSAYGVPDHIVNKSRSKVLQYYKRGVYTWVSEGKVTSFGVTRPINMGLNAAKAESTLRAKQQAQAHQRMHRDKDIYSPQELAEIDSLFFVEKKGLKAEEVRRSFKLLAAKYPKANRAGCAVLYLGQMSRGIEQMAYFQQAIANHGDCYYGDGVQVGAFARFLLGQACLKSGRADQARVLFDEIRRNYPDSVDHNGDSLVAHLPR